MKPGFYISGVGEGGVRHIMVTCNQFTGDPWPTREAAQKWLTAALAVNSHDSLRSLWGEPSELRVEEVT